MSTRIAVLCSGGGTNLQALIDAGVDGIITDYPTRLAGLLTEHGVEF